MRCVKLKATLNFLFFSQLIDTYGEVIRQHLLRFLLVHIYKDNTSRKPINTPHFLQLLKDNIASNSSDSNQQQPFITFAETFCAFFKSDSAPLVDLEYLYIQLDLNAFCRFALSSLLLLSKVKQPNTDQGNIKR